jgi:hypothetical protein
MHLFSALARGRQIPVDRKFGRVYIPLISIKRKWT